MTSATINPWEPARSAATALASIWPDPVALAAEGRLPHGRVRPFADALKTLEALIRSILLALVANISVTLNPARAGKRKSGRTRPEPAPVDLADPSTWRCAFVLAPPQHAGGRNRSAARTNPEDAEHRWLTVQTGSPEWLAMREAALKRQTASTFPLARRWQACLNVLADVQGAAQRAALAAARRAARLASRAQAAIAYFMQFEPEGGWNTDPVVVPEPPAHWREPQPDPRDDSS